MKKHVALPAALLLAVVTVGGCSQGQGANTSLQGETGNGVELTAGPIDVEALTIVAGESNRLGAVSAVVVNNGTTPDSLRRIVVDGETAQFTPDGAAQIGAGESLSIRTGGDLEAQVEQRRAEPGTYVEVSLDFAVGGRAAGRALVVPPVSFYSPAAPTS